MLMFLGRHCHSIGQKKDNQASKRFNCALDRSPVIIFTIISIYLCLSNCLVSMLNMDMFHFNSNHMQQSTNNTFGVVKQKRSISFNISYYMLMISVTRHRFLVNYYISKLNCRSEYWNY